MGLQRTSPVDEWLKPDNLFLIECWARDMGHKEVAAKMGVTSKTLSAWKFKYKEIGDALSKGKEVVDYKVENALLKSALGFKTTEIKVTIGKQIKNGQTFDITKETITKQVAPNVTACAIWLNNRCPDKWKRNRDRSLQDELEDNKIEVRIVRGSGGDDDTNKEVVLNGKKGKTVPSGNDAESGNKIKDRDYWPPDWQEED